MIIPLLSVNVSLTCLKGYRCHQPTPMWYDGVGLGPTSTWLTLLLSREAKRLRNQHQRTCMPASLHQKCFLPKKTSFLRKASFKIRINIEKRYTFIRKIIFGKIASERLKTLFFNIRSLIIICE